MPDHLFPTQNICLFTVSIKLGCVHGDQGCAKAMHSSVAGQKSAVWPKTHLEDVAGVDGLYGALRHLVQCAVSRRPRQPLRRTNHTPLPNIAVSRHSLRHTPPPQKYASLLPWYRGHSCFASHRSSLCDREQFTNRTSVTLLSLKIASQANAQHHVAALPSSLQRLRGLDESVPFLTAFLLSPVRMHLSG